MSSTTLSAPYIVTSMVVVVIYPVLGIGKEGEGFKGGDKTIKHQEFLLECSAVLYVALDFLR